MERRKHTGYPLGGNGQIQRLDYDTAVSLVLTAAKEYFNSSANLTHSCMDLARYWTSKDFTFHNHGIIEYLNSVLKFYILYKVNH